MSSQTTNLAAFSRLPRVGWLDIIQTTIACAALVPCLQGRPGTPKWLLLALSVPALRFLFVAAYRRRVLAWLARLWQSLEAYPVQTVRPPWPAVFLFVVLPYGLLLLSREYSFQSGDSKPVVLTAARLVTRGDCDISEYVEAYAARGLYSDDRGLPYFAKQTASGTYSGYPSGMVAFALPVTAAARLLGADLKDLGVQTRLEKWIAAWVAAACLGLYFLITLHLAVPKPAWIASMFLAVGSVLFSTVGQALWQHDGVIFWGLLAFWLEFRQARKGSPWGSAMQGLACAMLIACRLSAALFVVPFVAWVLLRAPRRGLLLAVCGLLAFVPWALFYGSIYGSPFGPSTIQMDDRNWSVFNPVGYVGVLLSPSHGLLVYQPWLLLAGLVFLPANRRLSGARRTACPAGWAWFCVVVCVCHLVLIGSWGCWWGGYCWGSRLAADIVPFAALLCVRPIAALWATVNGRWPVMVLAVLAGFLHLPAVFLKQDQWNSYPPISDHQERLWSWSDPPFLFSYARYRDPVQHPSNGVSNDP